MLRIGSRVLTLLGLLSLAAVLLARPINLTNSDIGRHLKNGEIVLREWRVPQANLYSSTYPEFPVINHHWGSGVVFHLVERAAGFTGLSLLFIALNLAALACFFIVAWRGSSFTVAAALIPLALPLLHARIEIRPEAFSLLLAGIFLLLLTEHRRGIVSFRALLITLPLLELLWINLHIYFFVGPLLVGLFLLEDLTRQLQNDPSLLRSRFSMRAYHASLLPVFLLTCAATFLNPAGVVGALQPFAIFRNFGYKLAENQSITFLEDYFGSYPEGLPYKIALGVLVGSWIAVAAQALRNRVGGSRGHRSPFPTAFLFLSVFFGVIGWLAIRNFAIAGLFFMPLAAANVGTLRLSPLIPEAFKRAARAGDWLLAPLLVLGVAAAIALPQRSFWQAELERVGIGLAPRNLAAAEFLERSGIQGPIFNNYDIGGYLIYALYPRERVFVDNRPEAYPAHFFEETLVPMQEDEATWQRVAAERGFNAIVFYRHDLTGWGQQFMIRRVFDPAWVPVFVDAYSLILVRRDGPNADAARAHELPRSMFGVRNG